MTDKQIIALIATAIYLRRYQGTVNAIPLAARDAAELWGQVEKTRGEST